MAKHTGTAGDYHAFKHNGGRGLACLDWVATYTVLLCTCVSLVAGGQGAETKGALKTCRVSPVLPGRVGLPEPNNFFIYA